MSILVTIGGLVVSKFKLLVWKLFETDSDNLTIFIGVNKLLSLEFELLMFVTVTVNFVR